MSYVYLTSDEGDGNKLYTVGFYKPDGSWEPESDHSEREDAAQRASWLNGGDPLDYNGRGLRLEWRDREREVAGQLRELWDESALEPPRRRRRPRPFGSGPIESVESGGSGGKMRG